MDGGPNLQFGNVRKRRESFGTNESHEKRQPFGGNEFIVLRGDPWTSEGKRGETSVRKVFHFFWAILILQFNLVEGRG